MKTFLRKIALFLLLCLAASLLALWALDPYYGNPLYRGKLQDLLQREGEVNTLFFGSSRFYRHIDPEVTDSLLAPRGISSYNMGATSLLNPQSYVIYEELLRRHDPGLDYVLLEMSGFRQIKPGNIPTPMNYYYLDPPALAWIARYMRASPRPLDVGGRIFLEYLASWGYKMLYAVPDLAGTLGGEPELPAAVLQGYRGYYSLDAEYRHTADSGNAVARRRAQFLEDSTVVDRYVRASRSAYGPDGDRSRVNRVHLEKLRELLDLSQKRGIELYFVISPRMARYDRILSVRDSLPAGRVIDLGSVERYPEFYSRRYTFDANHLNAEGARLFSRRLAEELRSRLGPAEGER